ncbi:hypothetical protein FNV64_01915 [Streptomyces sp. S1A1-7]|nr:hypothetical protein FNV64_01915 [Streptomyces sp. S1A1-7]
MGRHILHLRFDFPAGHDPDLPERLRRLLENITPRVQMIEPDSAVLDLTVAPAPTSSRARRVRSPLDGIYVAHGRHPPGRRAPGQMRTLPVSTPSVSYSMTIRLEGPWQATRSFS